MNFDDLYSRQPKVMKLINNSYRKNRLVHAYIFEGPRGTKKTTTAYYFTSLLLCEENNKPCGKCHNCLRIQNNTHPNVVLISPDGNQIKKEQIENLIHEFSLTSLEASKRVYIIKDIELLTSSAANSLLKFLEEPHPNIYGILITENLQNIISTIKSRSQTINFQKLNNNELIERLIEIGIDEELSYLLVNLSNDEDEIKALIEDEMVVQIIELVEKIAVDSFVDKKDPLVTFVAQGRFLLDESRKEYHYIFVDLLILFFTDLLNYGLDNIDMISFRGIINEVSLHYNDDVLQLTSLIDRLLMYKQRLNYNINLELLYCEIMLSIARYIDA